MAKKLEESSMSFEDMLQQSVQHTVINFIRKGDWMKLDYYAKLNLDAAWLREMHSRVNMDSVMELVKLDVERRIADGIMNAMAQEVANDVKSIMCNRGLREDIRSTIRAKIRSAETAMIGK